MLEPYYSTDYGSAYHTEIETFIASQNFLDLQGRVNLIFTSPPYPLKRKKKYGNRDGEEYLNWLVDIMIHLKTLLTDDGSLVVEIGNAWEPGEPEMSTLPIESLLAIKQLANFKLCQQFVWNNTAKLPSPAQWVNVERIRVKDSFTHIWWYSGTTRPKANNRNVLVEYSNSMRKLLDTQTYNPGARPSEHVISETSFLTNNGGAIASNVISSANTASSSKYQKYCKEHNLVPHPARMPLSLAEFFIRYLTDTEDLVFDPFSGSNTTGEASEILQRRWIGIEAKEEYLEGSRGRFNIQ